MKRIYSDIRAWWMKSEMDNVEIFIVDSNGGQYRPNLIIPNLLALKNLRDYCNEVLEEHSSYFKEKCE